MPAPNFGSIPFLMHQVSADGTSVGAVLRASSATYAVEGIGYTAYATPTDFIQICGSATKTVAITNFSIRMNSTAAALQTIYFIKRSTANVGGTLTTPTPVAYDSTIAAPTAVVSVYTAAPTTGTPVGNARIVTAASVVLTGAGGVAALTSNNYAGSTTFSFTQSIVLRGVAECLAINYNGAALTAGFTSGYSVEWIEF